MSSGFWRSPLPTDPRSLPSQGDFHFINLRVCEGFRPKPFRSGCSSAWLERYVRDVEAARSNRVTPIIFHLKPFGQQVEGLFLFVANALRGFAVTLMLSKATRKID